LSLELGFHIANPIPALSLSPGEMQLGKASRKRMLFRCGNRSRPSGYAPAGAHLILILLHIRELLLVRGAVEAEIDEP